NRLVIWAGQVADTMAAARPEMPPGIEDRAGDMWEPLLAIADAAGGDWPKRARDAATELAGAAKEAEPSLGVRLVADLKIVFDKRGEDKLATMQSSNLADIALIADVQGDGEEKANNTSPDDPGPISDCLRRHPGRRCDHCGSEFGILNTWG